MKRRCIRLFSLFLAFILFVGDGAVIASAAGTISLPSPSVYFGSSPKANKDGNVTIYTYSGYASFPKDKVDKYVKDMVSKGLKLTKEGTMDDGDILRRMEWKNDSAVILWWRKADKSIEIRVHPCVKLTESTVSVKNTDSEKNMLPMPRDYFTNKKKAYLDESTNALCYVYSYSSYPTDAANKYAAALEKLGFDASYDISTSSGHTRTVRHGNTLCIDIKYKKNIKELTVILYKNGLKKAGYISESDQKAQTAETTPAATTPTNSTTTVSTNKDGYLPDITKFMGVRMYDNRASSDGSWQYSITIASDDNGKKALREYAELLQSPEYKLELVDYQDIDYTLINRGHLYKMYFKYTGSKNIKPVTDSDGRKWHVCFSVSHIKDIWGLGPSLYVSMDYKDKLIDSGKTASVRVTDNLTGGNEYDPEPTGGDKHTVPCGTCNGTGDCIDCGGDGYVHSRASDEEDRNCPSCHPHRGKCGSCGGDGWLN